MVIMSSVITIKPQSPLCARRCVRSPLRATAGGAFCFLRVREFLFALGRSARASGRNAFVTMARLHSPPPPHPYGYGHRARLLAERVSRRMAWRRF